MAKIAITFEPKVVDPYNHGDSWLVEQDLSSSKVIGVDIETTLQPEFVTNLNI